MIYGHIHTSESAAAYSETIRKAIQILRETDVTDMHHGKYPRQTHECVPQPHPSKFKNYKDIIFSKCFSGFVPITYRFFFMLNGRLPTSKIFNIFKASFLIMFRL